MRKQNVESQAVELELNRRRADEAARLAEQRRERQREWACLEHYEESTLDRFEEEIQNEILNRLMNARRKYNGVSNYPKFDFNNQIEVSLPVADYGDPRWKPDDLNNNDKFNDIVSSITRRLSENLARHFMDIGVFGVDVSSNFVSRFKENEETECANTKRNLDWFYESVLPAAAASLAILFALISLFISSVGMPGLAAMTLILAVFSLGALGSLCFGGLAKELHKLSARRLFNQRKQKGDFDRGLEAVNVSLTFNVHTRKFDEFRDRIRREADKAMEEPEVAMKYDVTGVPEVDEEWEQMIAEGISVRA